MAAVARNLRGDVVYFISNRGVERDGDANWEMWKPRENIDLIDGFCEDDYSEQT